MSKFARLSNLAKVDLADIWFYIAQDDVDAARRFNEKILRKCQGLADSPGMGRERTELAAKLRGFPVGNYLIFYRETDFGIEVLRVLSGFRDIPRLFEDLKGGWVE